MISVSEKKHERTRPAQRLHAAPVFREEVFAVNFLRPRSLSRPVRRKIAYAVAACLFANFLILLFLGILSAVIDFQHKRLAAALQENLPVGMTAEDIEPAFADLRQKASAMVRELAGAAASYGREFHAGGKLAALGRTIPDRTWITEIRTDHLKRSLVFRAQYLMETNRKDRLPAKGWIRVLKEDPGFGTGLRRLELKRSSIGGLGSSVIYTFEIQAEWGQAS